MGTNYYATPFSLIDAHNKKKEKSIKEAGSMKGLIPIIEEYYNNRKPKPVHIGKSSAGWDFLFNYNQGKYYKNKEELISYLKNCIITNEYGEEYNYEGFWQNVVENRKWNGKPTKNHSSITVFASSYITIDGLEFLDCEFS